MRKAKAFTLVELLVVIGIIALLISILLPSLNKARESAFKIRCASQLRSIGQFYAMYVGQFKGKFPATNSSGNWAFGGFGGTLAGGNYSGLGPVSFFTSSIAKDPRVFYCPVLEARNTDNAQFTYARYGQYWKPTAFNNAYTSYDFWAGYPNNLTASNTVYLWQDSNLYNTLARTPRSNGDTVLATDMMIIRSTGAWTLRSNHWAGRKPLVKDYLGLNHEVDFSGGNVLYNDGHVVWKDAADTTPRITHGTAADYVEYFF